MAPAWGGALGNVLSSAATAYTQALLDIPEEKLERRKTEAEVSEREAAADWRREQASSARQKRQAGEPIETGWGIYAIDPATGRYRLELQRPEAPRKPFAKEAELELMLDWAKSDDPYKKSVADAYLRKQEAPARQADARITHLERQHDYWQQRADEAARHHSAMEQVYRQRAQQTKGELGSLTQAQQWLESGTPEQQEAARRYLDAYDREGRQESRRSAPVDETITRLELLQKRSSGLSGPLQQEADRLINLARQLKAQGQPVGDYLTRQIDRLDTQIRAQEARAARPPGSGGASQVDVPHGPTGPTSRYRGADVRTYHEAIREGIETLTPLDEKAATAEVSRQPIGPKRDGYIEAWRSKFPGKVFRPTPGIVPFPAPRQPTSGRSGERGRASAIAQPDTLLDQLAQERYGKKYVELEEAQKVDLEDEATLITGTTDPAQAAPQPAAPAPKAQGPTTQPPRQSAAPKPGTPEHRAYTMYKAEMGDVPQAQALEAWSYINQTGTADEKRAFRRAYQERFGEEVR